MCWPEDIDEGGLAFLYQLEAKDVMKREREGGRGGGR